MGKLKAVAELFEGRHFDREVIILCVRVRFAPDSPLEEGGFEPSVPRAKESVSPRGRELVRESVHLGATRDRSRGVICVCAVGVAC